MVSSPSSRQVQVVRLLAAIFVLAIALTQALPHYFTGAWAWTHPPQVKQLEQLQALQKQGLTVPDWQPLSQEAMRLGGHRWSVQQFVAPTPQLPTTDMTVVLMLRPQLENTDQPQIDWVNIGSEFGWTADSDRWIEFSAPAPSGHSTLVQARFLRYWDHSQTYAAVQWYAWSNGGSANSSRWFWVDQVSQWRDRQRMPWVAVSLLIPIEPLGELDATRAIAQSLGQTVQSTLLATMLPSSNRLSP